METLADGGLGKPLDLGVYPKWIHDLQRTILEHWFVIPGLVFAVLMLQISF